MIYIYISYQMFVCVCIHVYICVCVCVRARVRVCPIGAHIVHQIAMKLSQVVVNIPAVVLEI